MKRRDGNESLKIADEKLKIAYDFLIKLSELPDFSKDDKWTITSSRIFIKDINEKEKDKKSAERLNKIYASLYHILPSLNRNSESYILIYNTLENIDGGSSAIWDFLLPAYIK